LRNLRGAAGRGITQPENSMKCRSCAASPQRNVSLLHCCTVESARHVASLQNASFITETRFKRKTVKRLQQRCRAAAVRNSTRESGVSGVIRQWTRPSPSTKHAQFRTESGSNVLSSSASSDVCDGCHLCATPNLNVAHIHSRIPVIEQCVILVLPRSLNAIFFLPLRLPPPFLQTVRVGD
jgi:hypothetical protein